MTKDLRSDRWTCPNDRNLQLRSKLNAGWSYHTGKKTVKKDPQLTENELIEIQKVLQRSEQIEQNERERVKKLVDRLENMKRNASQSNTATPNRCALCGDYFRLMRSVPNRCGFCQKVLCGKCCIDTQYVTDSSGHTTTSSGAPSRRSSSTGMSISGNVTKTTVYLCRLCSEQREFLKKSGAWFVKKYPLANTPTEATTNGTSQMPHEKFSSTSNIDDLENTHTMNSNTQQASMSSNIKQFVMSPSFLRKNISSMSNNTSPFFFWKSSQGNSTGNVNNTDIMSSHEQDSFSYSSDANELFNEISSNFDSNSLNRTASNDNFSHGNVNHSTNSSSVKSKTPTSPNKNQEHFSFHSTSTNNNSNYQLSQMANSLKSSSNSNFGNLNNNSSSSTVNSHVPSSTSSYGNGIISTGPITVSSASKTSFYTGSQPSQQTPSIQLPPKQNSYSTNFTSGKTKQQTYLSNENLTGDDANGPNNQNHYTTVLNNILSHTNLANELNNSSSIGSMVNSSNTNVNMNTNTNTVNVNSSQQVNTTNNSIKSVNIINNINRTSNHFSIKIKNGSTSTSNGSTSSSGSSCSTNSARMANSPSINAPAEQYAKRELASKSISSGVINNSLGACAGLLSNSNNASTLSINSIQSVASVKSFNTEKVLNKILSSSNITNNILPNGDANNDGKSEFLNGIVDLPKSASVQHSVSHAKKSAVSLNSSPTSSISNLSLKDHVPSVTDGVESVNKLDKKTKIMEWCSTQLSMDSESNCGSLSNEKKQSKISKFKGSFRSKLGFGSSRNTTADLFSEKRSKPSKKYTVAASSTSVVASASSLVGSTNSLNLHK